VLVSALAVVAWPSVAHGAGAGPAPGAVPTPARFEVGAASVGIDPTVTTYAGGFGASPPIAAGHVVGAPLSVRALYVSNGSRAVELEAVDSQGEFAAYQEGAAYGITVARQGAARAIDADRVGPAMSAADIIIQATHGHAEPTLQGLWGPVPVAYLAQVTEAEQAALVQAARAARPAHIEVGSADATALDDVNLAQYDAYPGWAGDPLLAVVRAVDAGTGATIATYATVPAHPDIVCGACMDALDADYPGVVRSTLEAQFGGVAMVGPGTLGREETPVQATDTHYMPLLAEQAADLVDVAVRGGHFLTSDVIGASQRFVRFPGTNAALLALVEANHLPDAQKQQVLQASGQYPIDRADTAPYQVGNMVGTWLTAFRLGNVAVVSEPGEGFPEVRETIADAAWGADLVIGLSEAQDDIGYFYPAWESALAAAVYPSDGFTNSVAPEAGDVVIKGQVADLQALGFATTVAAATPLPFTVTQSVAPGLQVVGGPFDAVAGPGGRAAVQLLAVYSPPDLPEGTLNYGPPNGVALEQATLGPVQWDFGDGTTGTSGYHEFSGSDLLPTIFVHDFVIGVHTVRATVTSVTGQRASWTFTVTVRP